MNKFIYFLVCLTPLTFQGVESKRIMLIPQLVGSHVIEITTVGKELMQRGHDVYLILPKFSRFEKSAKENGFNILSVEVESTKGLSEDEDSVQVGTFNNH